MLTEVKYILHAWEDYETWCDTFATRLTSVAGDWLPTIEGGLDTRISQVADSLLSRTAVLVSTIADEPHQQVVKNSRRVGAPRRTSRSSK